MTSWKKIKQQQKDLVSSQQEHFAKKNLFINKIKCLGAKIDY